MQNRYQGQREVKRLLYETAYKDHGLRLLHREDNIAAFPVILDYHARMMRLINEDKLTPQSLKAVMLAQGTMNAAVLAAARQLDDPDASAAGSA